MSLTGEEIWAALADNGRAPHGPVRIARGEYLVDAAEAAGDPAVRAQALIDPIEEIWAALADNGRAPHGPVRIARGEYLVDAAEAAGDPAVRAQALIDVIEAYEFGAEQPKMLVPFAKLLRLWDE